MNEQRYEIGTLSKGGDFESDTISNDPELTTFPTLHLAIQEMREVIRQSEKTWGSPMTNGAIYDRERDQIIWRQEETLRSVARQAVTDAVANCAAYSHMQNYYKLHVYRDGTAGWTEHINQSDDIIDAGSASFAAIPSVCCVGSGSYACNCNHCNEVYYAQDEALALEQGRDYNRANKYASRSEAIEAAVADSDLTGIEAEMLAAFDAIPAGYFNDEEAR